MKQFVFFSVVLVLFAVTAAVAEPMLESDIPVRYTSWHIAYDLNADGSYVETNSWSGSVL